MTRFLARELATAHWFDIGAARRDLGYEPGVAIDEGLRRLADHLAAGRPPPAPPLIQPAVRRYAATRVIPATWG